MLFAQPGFDPAKLTFPPHLSPLIDRSHLEAAVKFKDPEPGGENTVAGLDCRFVRIGESDYPQAGGHGENPGIGTRTSSRYFLWPASSNQSI